MNAKQTRFVQEYLIDGNATQAAIRAGYSENTATEMGYENLRKPHIAEAIRDGQAKLAERCEIDASYVINGIVGVVEEARANGDHTPALKGYEMLGKNLGLFVDKSEVTGKDGKPIEHEVKVEFISANQDK